MQRISMLFGIPVITKPKKKMDKVKLYRRKQWQEWAYDENFISALASLDGIHTFQKRCGRNGLFYSIKYTDVIEKHFVCLGWEVYASGKIGSNTLYIKAKREEE